MVTHPLATRIEFSNTAVDHIDDGAGFGKLQLTKTADDYSASELVVELTLPKPAFTDGDVATAIATLLGVPLEVNATLAGTNTVVQARFVDSDDNEAMKGDVTATGGGGDFEMTNTAVNQNDPVRVTLVTYTPPA